MLIVKSIKTYESGSLIVLTDSVASPVTIGGVEASNLSKQGCLFTKAKALDIVEGDIVEHLTFGSKIEGTNNFTVIAK